MNQSVLFRSGSIIRTDCPQHPGAEMRQTGPLARCSECGEARELCLIQFGHKECVREFGHDGAHVSRSGSSWPDDASDELQRSLRIERNCLSDMRAERDAAVAALRAIANAATDLCSLTLTHNGYAVARTWPAMGTLRDATIAANDALAALAGKAGRDG